MALLDTALFLTCALLAGALFDALARRWRLPFTLLLMGAGFAVSEGLVSLGYDTRLRWYHFNDLVFYGLIPVLIFETAARLDRTALLREWRAIAMMAGPALIASTAVTAGLVLAGIGHPSGFPLAAALLAAALLSATDPSEVIESAHEHPGTARAATVLEGESVLSDVVAVTLFAAFLNGALMRDGGGVSDAAWQFCWSAGAGAAVGIVAGILARTAAARVRTGAIRALTLGAIAYAAFVLCQHFVSGSGAVAVLVTTLLARSGRAPDPAEQGVVEALGWSARVVLFVIAGATVTTFMFRDQWLAMLIGIGAVLVARIAVAEVSLLLLNSTHPHAPAFDPRERLLVGLGGVRGAIVLALALSLPLELESWYTVQSMAYGVVLFTLAVHPFAARAVAKR